MKKRTKRIIIVSVLLIFAIIAIFSLTVFLYEKIGIHTITIVENDGDNIVYAGSKKGVSYKFELDNVIFRDANLNEIDKTNVNVGDYIYLYIKDGYYNYCDNTTYYCKVNSIENNNISVEMPEWYFYSFSTENVKIKDINGKEINSSELKTGDTIKVINIYPKYITDLAMTFEGFSASSIYDVKSIKIIDTDEETKASLENRNIVAIKKAFVAGVNKENIYVVDSENQNLLYQVSFSKEGNIGFGVGQEVMIYFNGKTSSTRKNGISEIKNVGKIEIVDNSFNHLISNDILKKFYTTYDNVDVKIESLTNTEITFTVTDKNAIKYNFNNNCAMFKNVSEKPSNEPIIGEDGSMSMPAYEGDKWQELSEVSETVENKANIENIDENTKRITYDWSNIYGQLKSGEYRFVLGDIKVESNYLVIRNNIENISVEFELDDNGKISDIEIEKGF